MKLHRTFTLILLTVMMAAVWASYTSCGATHFSSSQDSVTIAGNPYAPSTNILLQSLCTTLSKCNANVSYDDCRSRVLAVSGLGTSLGLPSSFSGTYASLIQGEQTGAITGNTASTTQCSTDISAQSCTGTGVQGAYDPNLTNPYSGIGGMIPQSTGTSSCSTALASSGTPPAPVSLTLYGPAIGYDTGYSTKLGGSNNNVLAYRFNATSSQLKSLRLYLVYGSTAVAGGNGGSIEVSIQTDDGSSNHLPTGTKLATFALGSAASPLGNPPPAEFPVVTFAQPVSLTPGQLYHVVLKNTDPSPAVNFFSMAAMYKTPPTVPNQPLFSDNDFAQLVNTGSGWSMMAGYTPVVEYDYSDGKISGMGYIAAWSGSAKTISGTSMVRETFLVSNTNVSVSQAFVRVLKNSGASPLNVLLETATGITVDTCSIPASAITASYTWVNCSFPATHVLAAGQGYHLVISTSADTSYTMFPMRKGRTYGYVSPTFFGDGNGEFTTGAGWSGFPAPGGNTPTTEGDLQFYLAP